MTILYLLLGFSVLEVYSQMSFHLSFLPFTALWGRQDFLSTYKVLLIFIKNILNCFCFLSQMTHISYRNVTKHKLEEGKKKSSHSEIDTVNTLMYIFLHFFPCIFNILTLGMMMKLGRVSVYGSISLFI